jgi:hypothetical protein
MEKGALRMERAAYEKALARARAEDLEVRGHAIQPTGEAWFVGHPGEVGEYTVRQARGAVVTSCNCEAGRRGKYCKHRAWVRFVRLQAQAARAAIPVAVPATPKTTDLWVTTQGDRFTVADVLAGRVRP